MRFYQPKDTGEPIPKPPKIEPAIKNPNAQLPDFYLKMAIGFTIEALEDEKEELEMGFTQDSELLRQWNLRHKVVKEQIEIYKEYKKIRGWE